MTTEPVHTGNPESGARLPLSSLQHAWLAEIGVHLHAPAGPRRARPDLSQAAGHTGGPDAAAAPRVVPQRQRSRAGAATKTETPQRRAPAALAAQSPLPQDMPALADHARACTACDLHLQRGRVVFGQGDTQAPQWLIVGEAPARADDRTGLPFQGRPGQLLHAMLLAAGVHAPVWSPGADAVRPAWARPVTAYFTTLVKCRPLGNHSPEAAHIAACTPYLQQQIRVLQPRRILALGRLAAQALLQTDEAFESLRGTVHQVPAGNGGSIPLVATWHPATLLVHPQHKAQAWHDLVLAAGLVDDFAG